MKKSITLLTLFITFNLFPFSSLKKAEEYAKEKIEYPDSDNQDWLAPNYTNYIKSQRPSYFKRIFRFLKNHDNEYWSALEFNKKISEITKKNYELKKTIELEINNDSKFVIFGPLGGAYHSLVRDLKELEKKQIINNNLQLTSKDYYIIFMGNSVGTTPYNMETLYLITDLILKNKDRVFYLEGEEEYRENWADRTFGREIEIKGISPSSKKDSLKNLMKDFFRTLPNTVIINLPKSQESITIGFFTKPKEQINPKHKIKLEFHSDGPKRDFPEDGVLVISENGKKIVKILSSPTRSNRYLYSISNDNFAILEINNGNLDGFMVCGKKASENVEFNCRKAEQLKEKKSIPKKEPVQETNNNISPKTSEITGKILFGSSSDITKSNNILSIPMKQGLSLKLNFQNSLGGINGQLLQIVFMDDQYTPAITRRNIERLISEYNTNLILSPIGSPTLAATLDLIKDKKILVLFPNSGSPLFRNPSLTNIINFRTSYMDESKALIEYLTKNFSVKKIAFLYQNDEYGIPPLEYSIKRLNELGIDENNIVKIPYSRNDINIQSAIKKIVEFGPDALGFYALPFIGGEIIRQMGPAKLANIKLFGLSPMSEEGFKNLVKSNGLKIITANAVPNPNSTQLEITQEYQKNAIGQGILNYSNVYMLEGYINMSITIEILKRIKEVINSESIVKAAENIKDLKFKGLYLNFNPLNRQINNKLWLDTGDIEWLEVTV